MEKQVTLLHFYRCKGCLSTVCVDRQLNDWKHDTESGNWYQPKPVCQLCDERMLYQGQVNNGRVTNHHYGSPCDGRCTGAQGPDCDCQCGGANHGTGRVVKYTVDNGAAVVHTVPTAKAKKVAAEYKEALATAEAFIESQPHYQDYIRGHWISDKSAWWRIRGLRTQISKAASMKTHKRRMELLKEVTNG